jgi:hypothetical protein
MKKFDKKKGIALAALLLAVGIGGVAFAALSSTLNINGTAYVRDSNFGVIWQASSWGCTAAADARVISVGNDAVDATISVSFLSKNDSVTCTGIAENTGTVDAKLGTVTPNLSGLTDMDGGTGDVTAALTYSGGTAYAPGDVLAASATKTWQLVLTYTGDGGLTTASTPVNFSFTIPYAEN